MKKIIILSLALLVGCKSNPTAPTVPTTTKDFDSFPEKFVSRYTGGSFDSCRISFKISGTIINPGDGNFLDSVTGFFNNASLDDTFFGFRTRDTAGRNLGINVWLDNHHTSGSVDIVQVGNDSLNCAFTYSGLTHLYFLRRTK